MKKGSKRIQKKSIIDQGQENCSNQKNFRIIILIRTIIPWNLMQLKNNLREERLRNSIKERNR